LNDKADILNREPFIQNLQSFILALAKNNQSFSLAIDGMWGAGKTYILNKLEKRLGDIQSEETSDNQFYIFHYNCWQYDYYQEPAVAIVSAMLDQADSELESKIKGSIKDAWKYAKTVIEEIAGEFVENKIGINLTNIVGNIKENGNDRKENEREFDIMFAFRKTLVKARNRILKLSQRKQIVFVVDELDRCIPSYSIKVLERMHHFFEGLNQVIVVYAMDTQQLNHSIKSIYGDDTDVDRYLKKFINLQIRLDLGDIQGEMFQQYDSYLSMFEFKTEDEKKICFIIFKDICRILNFEIRTQEEIMRKMEIIHKLLPNRNRSTAAVFLVEILVALINASLKPKSPLRDNLEWIFKSYKPETNDLVNELGEMGERLHKYLHKILYYSREERVVIELDSNYFTLNNDSFFRVANICLRKLLLPKNEYHLSDTTLKDTFEQCQAFINYSKYML
jgi:hypothetical protein